MGASHIESNPQGQQEDDKEEQRQGLRCKSFDRFHQSGCASGRGSGFRARRSSFLKKGGVVQIWRETCGRAVATVSAPELSLSGAV
jgi:hypothetical protein